MSQLLELSVIGYKCGAVCPESGSGMDGIGQFELSVGPHLGSVN
jgi:hypothetical protein